jgi:FkbM family methyltransferase
VKWIRNWLKEGGVIVDSGANIGQMLIYYLLSPDTQILCIEPVPKCVDWLIECINAGGYEDRVTVARLLLDASEGVTELKVAGEGDTGEWSTVHTQWFKRLNTETIECDATTFDNLILNSRLSSVRFWKLDVEGAELRALTGARHSLKEGAVEALLVEIIQENSFAVNQLLNEFGYVAHRIKASGIPEIISIEKNCSNLVGNCLYLPIERSNQ